MDSTEERLSKFCCRAEPGIYQLQKAYRWKWLFGDNGWIEVGDTNDGTRFVIWSSHKWGHSSSCRDKPFSVEFDSEGLVSVYVLDSLPRIVYHRGASWNMTKERLSEARKYISMLLGFMDNSDIWSEI